LDFFDLHSIKSGQGEGQGQGQAGSNMSSHAFGDSFAVRPKEKKNYVPRQNVLLESSVIVAHAYQIADSGIINGFKINSKGSRIK
jgi:hypothetical protein